MRLIDRPVRAFLERGWRIAIRLEMLRERHGDDYTRRVNAMNRRLGLPQDYAHRGLIAHREATELVAVPCGRNGALRLMTPATRSHFLAMRAAAAADGVTLRVRWAFRSVDDQARLIREHLSYGEKLDDILSWAAAPGYSEHHTGRALDFDCIPRGRPFEDTAAFPWLARHGEAFHFRLSYPLDNAQGIVFEPWHWFCHSERERPAEPAQSA